MTQWQKAGDGCSCWVNPNPFTYYGIVEPGDALEPNPLCKKHFARWQVACINWSSPADVPHAMTYCLVYGEAKLEMFHDTWEDAMAWITEFSDHLAQWADTIARRAREAS